MKAFVVAAISRDRHKHICQVRVGAHADHAFGGADFRDLPSSGEEPRRWFRAHEMHAFMASKADLA
jgi:hypothetical protein